MPSPENETELRPVIFGMPFDALTERETLDRIFEFAASRGPRGCRIAATVNVDFVVNTYHTLTSAPRRPDLAAVLQRAELVVADGMPLVWLSKLLGTPLPERVAGSDLVPMIAERAAREKVKLYFLGGAQEHTCRAAELLRARHPGLEIELDTPFVKLDAPDAAELDREICRKINASGASILLVGFGNPKQELWLERNRHNLDCNIAIGVGGTFNFIAGAVKRAPNWMRRSGTEWIYRIIQEPRRLWKRYFIGLFQFNMMALAAFLNRPRRGGAELVRDESGELCAAGKGRFSPRALADILAAAETGPVRIAGLSRRQKRQLRALRLAHLVAN
jgi:N-acetylglucosaminyldiphosphoundecaprenol N-acetyl-beta-D-mannosaminyltransferase